MSDKIRKILVLLNLIVVLAFLGKETWQKERIREKGELFLFALAPVDPRSLMQGDYMRLGYEITRSNFSDDLPNRGFLIFTPDSERVARFVRFQKDSEPISTSERKIKFHRSQFAVSFGAEEYFFQEGTADKFSEAKFGGLKVDAAGNGILVGVYDKNRKEIR
ncbi:GDYXXLXY protein [Leptospira fluminis]|uniref:GDYXXLXY protein n=1 Tax=Leptospira fluminis TaxID=2484979 RepID=A0A4R9GS57_9LEPT|nr:GDYXXLXY domain-containing protein [Leptospira fluminis]TGK21004.1 GDYXXLXY protein [Leptospira fluminis]